MLFGTRRVCQPSVFGIQLTLQMEMYLFVQIHYCPTTVAIALVAFENDQTIARNAGNFQFRRAFKAFGIK